MSIIELLSSANLDALDNALRMDPTLARQGIPLPNNTAKANPLHRICDAVFSKHISEDVGIEIAKIFMKHGAPLNESQPAGQDSPLTAACSLQCDELALFYIDHGASIHHPGCHGGTPLHWAAWCGRDRVANKILAMDPNINQLCIAFKSTPLFWAMHGYRFGGAENRHNQIQCVRLLINHGADPSIPNFEGYKPSELIQEGDTELQELFR